MGSDLRRLMRHNHGGRIVVTKKSAITKVPVLARLSFLINSTSKDTVGCEMVGDMVCCNGLMVWLLRRVEEGLHSRDAGYVLERLHTRHGLQPLNGLQAIDVGNRMHTRY